MSLMDVGRLEAWLDGQGVEAGHPVTVRPLAGGASNVMFAIDRGAGSWVLRRPAQVAVERADAGMLREYRILHALAGSAVPHPGVVALCEDRAVLGSVFYLMQRVDGGPALPVPAALDNPRGRSAIADALVDALARLHDFDWRGAGLAKLGRPDGFHERQVERWMRQLRSYDGRELPGVDVVTAWLLAHRPADFEPALMHGDYHTMNVLMTFDPAPAVAAIVDWETATIGDPVLDLAGFSESWARAAGHDWPGEPELTDRYRQARGLSCLPDLTYYKVLYNFRLAVLLEGIFQRARRDPTRAEQPGIGEFATSSIRRAASLAANAGQAPAGIPDKPQLFPRRENHERPCDP
jgi:aminoglycoside phosphotransferase (APT) family kinase protein